jgi:hypothetical protein
MSIKNKLILIAANTVSRVIQKRAKTAIDDQEKIFHYLINKAKNTDFGKDHSFSEIKSISDFQNKVPVRDYEQLRKYFDKITQGNDNVLWIGKPKYLAKTSGTTSGIKYIPVSRQSVPNHINSARNAIFTYISEKKDSSIFNGKMIFLSGSPELETIGGIPTGRLSGIVNHEIPSWIRTNQVPSWDTNCIEDWEVKLEKIIDETVHLDMRVIGGIPPWVQMYFERLIDRTGKKNIIEIFPNFTLFIYGGVNYEPYRATLEKLIGKKVDSIEYFPASEGFFAFQDKQKDSSLLLNSNSGIFYEFIPLDEYGKKDCKRLALKDIEINKDYALVVSNNAGLFAYDIGDVVRFTSINPYKLLVTGRVKHFISAFGEHVIAKEVEEAMKIACDKHFVRVNEFTVAPQVNPDMGEIPYHEWLIEFESLPSDIAVFSKNLDEEMVKQNIYYQDLIEGKILQPLKISILKKGTFIEYMKTQGKLGGQNKVPRLTNDRKIAEALLNL